MGTITKMEYNGTNRELDKTARIALVTGASSGIGSAISKKLCELGYEVYGIGRMFETKSGIEPETKPDKENFVTFSTHFHEVVCDLLDTDSLIRTIHEIDQNQEISLLINNAGCAYYGLHEELNPQKISEMVRVNLEVPMILTQQLLRTLKKNAGTIINISSVAAIHSNPHGCAYGATKAGLSSFSDSLFDEARKYGLKVMTIQPDLTQTKLYRNADFQASEDLEAALQPQDVADAVEYALNQRNGMVVRTITLQPQKHRIDKKNVKN